ncbi:MAG: hypothetical protein QOG88_990 [Actinomycetota bacterium]|nr:hypothetical protein [Actinomycetota bacterium]
MQTPTAFPHASGNRRSGVLLLAMLAGTLLVAYVSLFFQRGFGFPVGADASVYLWWTGLAGNKGLSVVNGRAGIPAVALVLSGVSGVGTVTIYAGLQCALGTATGLAAAALVAHDKQVTRHVILVGLLSGTFAVYIATGYFSTLGFGLLLLGAMVCLAEGTDRATVLAAGLLGAAGLTHALFFGIGAAVLLLTAVLAVRAGERAQAVSIVGAVLGAGSLLGIGAVALSAGVAPLVADTSRDGFLRRVGLLTLLRSLYVHRVALHAAHFVLWASVPLGVVGWRATSGYLRRLLTSWTVILSLGISLGLATGWFPPERVLSVSFVVPILAATGIESLLSRRHAASALAAAAGVAVLLVAAGWVWFQAVPPVFPIEAARAEEAARYAAATPPGTPLVFEVSGADPLTFLATRAANEFRAAVPPDRISDVYIAVPPPEPGADAERQALWRRYRADLAAAVRRSGLQPVTFRLTPFIRTPFAGPAGPARAVLPGVRILGEPDAPDASVATPLTPSSPLQIAVAAVLTLLLLAAVGSGWVRGALSLGILGVAISPGVGLGVLTLSAIGLERVGVQLSSRTGAASAMILATAGGWVLSWRRSRLG